MSFELAQKVLRADVNISSAGRLILIAIADRIDGKGYSFQSVGGMSKQLNMSRQTIHRTLKTLEGNGIIEIRRRTGIVNHYSIEEEALKRVDNEETGCNTMLQVGVTSCYKGCNNMEQGVSQNVTLINKLIDKGIDKENNVGHTPLAETLPKLKAVEKKKQIKITTDMGKHEMKVLDSIQTAIDGTGLKQKKNPTPQSLWKKAVSEWRIENDVTDVMLSVTQADAGKLNTVAKKLGRDFKMILMDCVENWSSYVKYTNDSTGGNWIPSQPSINYFVTNINEAKTFDVTNMDADIGVDFGNANLLS